MLSILVIITTGSQKRFVKSAPVVKLFLSYSQDDKAWVHELWRALRDRAGHDARMDSYILPVARWRSAALQNIADCDCFIYILTPKSAESSYCQAELEHALALNKPIVPLILKPCDYPASLETCCVQYQSIVDDMDMGDVLLVIAHTLGQIGIDTLRDNPQAEKESAQIFEVFSLAEETLESDVARAAALFQHVVEVDPQGWGLSAAERLTEIRFEQAQNYANIVQMASNPERLKAARVAAHDFVEKYGAGYDPIGTLSGLLEQVTTPPPVPAILIDVLSNAESPIAEPQPAHDLTLPGHLRPLDILPPPFAWIDIPAGEVTLDQGGYVPKGGQTFDVPAFAIAKYPLTNAQFGKFIDAQGYSQPRWWTVEGWQAREKERWTEPRNWSDRQFNQPDYPVVGVSWFEAVAFCLWLGEITGEKIMLPTAQQWQRAAQGDSNQDYPWGDTFDKTRCNFDGQGTTPVNQYEGIGDSPFGVVDMSGNAWEWCVTEYGSGDIDINKTVNSRELRGSSWLYSYTSIPSVADRDGSAPSAGYCYVGFRCVRLV